jgi:hypothetical protein
MGVGKRNFPRHLVLSVLCEVFERNLHNTIKEETQRAFRLRDLW